VIDLEIATFLLPLAEGHHVANDLWAQLALALGTIAARPAARPAAHVE
jgi:hypothetical protein